MASQGWAQAVQLSTADRVLLPFPLAFTGGMAVFLFTYWAGGRLVLEPGFDPDRALDLFERERITGFFAVPVIHQTLVDHPRWATADLSSWRVASAGGAPVPESLIRSVQDRGVPMLQGYSLTEGSAGVTVLPARDDARFFRFLQFALLSGGGMLVFFGNKRDDFPGASALGVLVMAVVAGWGWRRWHAGSTVDKVTLSSK